MYSSSLFCSTATNESSYCLG